MKKNKNLKSYVELLNELKLKIKSTQLRTTIKVNNELVLLYWAIGKKILQNQNNSAWGSKIIDLLAQDLSGAFPDIRGFSIRNLKYMRSFAEAYPNIAIVQEASAQLTWYHNTSILDKVKNNDERIWYIHKTIKNGWSRNVLVHQIESKLYQRQLKTEKTHNFKTTLPKIESELAHQILKDPYIFDFLSMDVSFKEKQLEDSLISHLTRFLLELGEGFAFIAKQYKLPIGNRDYYLDLLFYHLKLRCYIVIELKVGEFRPEYAGKMNFYLSAVDDLLTTKNDHNSIGIILCKDKEKVVVEYALKNIKRPIGVSQYKLSHTLPAKLKRSLPSVKELEEQMKTKIIKSA